MRILLVGIAIAAAGCGARGPVPVAGAPGVTIPAVVKRGLDERWRGWQIVPPPADASACANRFDTAPGAVLSGDWDGDGESDLAFQISSPDGRRIVAAFRRIEGEYALNEVAPVKDAAGVLGVKRRARSYRHQPNGIEHFYNADTLAFGACTQPETGYFWTGTAFEARPVF